MWPNQHWSYKYVRKSKMFEVNGRVFIAHTSHNIGEREGGEKEREREREREKKEEGEGEGERSVRKR